MNTNAEMDVPATPPAPVRATGQVTGGEKRVLGNCPKCGDPLTNRYGVVRCTKWSCDFIEGLKEFVEGKHLARIAEEAAIEQNLANIARAEKRRESRPIDQSPGLIGRILRR